MQVWNHLWMDLISNLQLIEFDSTCSQGKYTNKLQTLHLKQSKKHPSNPSISTTYLPSHTELISGVISRWNSIITKSIFSPPISIPLPNNNPSNQLQSLRTSRPRRSNPSLPNLHL